MHLSLSYIRIFEDIDKFISFFLAQKVKKLGDGYISTQKEQEEKTGYLANNYNEFKDYVVKLLKDDDLRAEFGKNAKLLATKYRVSRVAETWIKLYKFVINDLYPLRYHDVKRKRRVELVKEFIHQLPNVNF